MQNSLEILHDQQIRKIAEELKALNQPVSLDKSASQSNTTRGSVYKQHTKKLSLDCLNRVLRIDKEKMVAHVEPRICMKDLVLETLKQGLIPLVVPEFAGITVGGAIMGCGGESNSHIYGLFHDTCLEYELLTGSGDVIHASPHEHPELFHAVTGSYGTLALLLKAEVRLAKALPFVTLTVHHFGSSQEALTFMRSRLHQEYLEGIVFSDTHAVVIEGRQTEQPAATLFTNSAHNPWYYAYVQKQHSQFSMPIFDYLFRYDRGAFWMGAYVLQASILKKLLLEGIWKLKKPSRLTEDEIKKFSKIAAPNAALNFITHPFTNSQTLFKLLHMCETWVNERFMVQDFTLPEENASLFIETLTKNCPIYPLWLCPIKNAPTTQLFAPNALEGQYSINVGVYGIPNSSQEALGLLERRTRELKGRKWLYAHSAYSEQEFWDIYPKTQYEKLRFEYESAKTLLTIDNKVLV
ncbi:MAG: FAD-binding oxidoreductase [Chlamydiales bacterium]|nr:FAD-binding oxidoreductase [Chlamydiales bacterium]